jgi:hypothetical protein
MWNLEQNQGWQLTARNILKLIFQFSSVSLYYIAVTNIFIISFPFSFDYASNYKYLIFDFFMLYVRYVWKGEWIS